MAIKTKVRLTQVSGSMPTDSESAAASTSLALDDLGDILNHMASSIKRIHGGATWTAAASGSFTTNIYPASADGASLGFTDKEWSDLYLADGGVINLGSDQDVTLTHVADAGVLVGGTRYISFADANSHISNPGAGLKLTDHAVIEVEAATSIQMDSPIIDFEDDGVILQFGDGDDVTLTHVHNTGLRLNSTSKLEFTDGNAYIHHDGTDLKLADDADINLVAGADVLLDAATTVKIDSDSGDISFEDGGVAQLAIDMDGEATGIVIQPKVASDDLIFKTQGGTEALRIEDDAAVDFGGGAGSSGVTITAAGQITADGRVIVDDATEATSTTDGSLQTDGGLSVAKSAVIGDDLDLLSDGAILNIGNSSKFTLTAADANNAVVVTANHRLALGNAGEYIAGDGTDMKIVSSGDVDVTATLFDVTGAGQFSGNLTVGGNLDINGTTTTVDTANLTVQDSIIALGVSGSDGSFSNVGDRAIIFARGSAAHSLMPALNYGDDGVFEFGTFSASAASGTMGAASAGVSVKAGALLPMASDGGALGSTSLMWSDAFLASGAVVNFNNGDVTMTHSANLLSIAGGNTRVARLEIDSASDYIDVDTDLKIIAGADVVIDPAGGELKVDGNVVPNSDSADSLGASGTAWANLYVDAIDLNGQGSISMGGTGRIDLDADDDTSIRASADDTIAFEIGGSDLYSMNSTGLNIADDKKLVFGNGSDASFEYDEDGNDVLLYAGASMRFGDDIKLEFGAAGDASIEYDEDGTDQLRFALPSAGMVLGGTTPKLVIGDAGAEDTMVIFDGNAQDYRIGLDDGTDVLEFGVGATHGTTVSLKMDASLNVDVAGHNGTVGLKLGGTTVTSTAAEINLLDGGTSVGGSVTLVDGDGIFVNDGGTSKLQPLSDVAAYVIGKRQKSIVSGSAVNADTNVATGLADWSEANMNAKEVYVNGQLMTPGNDAASNGDWYPGGGDNVKFEFALQAEDIVQFVVWY